MHTVKRQANYEFTHCPILTPDLVEFKSLPMLDGDPIFHIKWTMDEWKSFVEQVKRFDEKLLYRYQDC
jgi:hypothetical protein